VPRAPPRRWARALEGCRKDPRVPPQQRDRAVDHDRDNRERADEVQRSTPVTGPPTKEGERRQEQRREHLREGSEREERTTGPVPPAVEREEAGDGWDHREEVPVVERVQRKRKTERPAPDPVAGARQQHRGHDEREAGAEETGHDEEARCTAPEPGGQPGHVADDDGILDRMLLIREQRRMDVPGEEAARDVAQRVMATVPVARGLEERGGNERPERRCQSCAQRDRRPEGRRPHAGADRGGHAKRMSAMVPTMTL
jgi:hypothetical protein